MLGLIVSASAGVGRAEAQALGYAIVGPAGYSGFFGSSASLVHAAGGGEVLVAKGAGVSGEAGVLANSDSRLVVVSVNGAFHFSNGPARRGPAPFVTGGYTHMGNAEGSFSGWNVGGGVDLWMNNQVGLRVEFRDHVRPDFRGAVQYWAIRAGVSVR